MSEVGLPRIPSGQWGHHFPVKPVFISWEVNAGGKKVWRVMGPESVMVPGSVVLVSRFQKLSVRVRLGEPVAEYVSVKRGRFVVCGFLNVSELS